MNLCINIHKRFRAITFVEIILYVFTAAYSFLNLFVKPKENSPRGGILEFLNNMYLLEIASFLFILASGIGLFHIFFIRLSRKQLKVRSRVAYILFLMYLFFLMVSVTTSGVVSYQSFTTAAFAMISAAVYISNRIRCRLHD